MIGTENAVLNIARAMANHASQRQAVLAENIAQANTPGYRAKDVDDFATIFRSGRKAEVRVDQSQPVQPNGNSVSLEQQVMNLAEAKGQHSLALGLWEKMMSMHATALGRR